MLFFITNSISGYTQHSHTITSDDGKVTAENFIGFGEGRDSVIVKHKKHKIKFSRFNPLFDFTDEHGYNPVDYSFLAYSVKKNNKKDIYDCRCWRES